MELHGFARVRAAARLVWLAGHLARGWADLVVLCPWLPRARREARVQAWCAKFLHISGVTVLRSGTAGIDEPVLLVSNHVSWLDVVVIQSLRKSRFVAKAEIRGWAVIGAMATRCGTVYVDRKRKSHASTVAGSIEAALRAGDTVALFPEGTSTDGTSVLPFHAGLLQGAIGAGAAALPVALKFLDTATGQVSTRAAYCGEDSLLGSVWRTLQQPVTVHVAFGERVRPLGLSRRQLAMCMHEKVRCLLAAGTDAGGNRHLSVTTHP
jgi:1-acyl-sn-glycerol-3-phosphate acyltransferase